MLVLLNYLSDGAPEIYTTGKINLFLGIADIFLEQTMIRVTRLNGAPMILNSDLIEHLEETSDTVIALTTGQSLRVRENAEEVLSRIIDFRRTIQTHVTPQPPLRSVEE
jgi:flagellar protein FlbD